MSVKPKGQAQASESVMETDLPTVQDSPEAESVVGVVSPEVVEEKVRTLERMNRIMGDVGKEIAFEGEDKALFVANVRKGYKILASLVHSISQTGEFLAEAQSQLKGTGLWLRFLEEIGFGRRSAYNYIQIHSAFGEKLPQFAHLGIRKLQAASRLHDPVKYVEEHLTQIADEPADKFEENVRASLKKKVSTGKKRGPKSRVIEHGEVRLLPSRDGKSLRVEGLSPDLQEKIIQALNDLLSKGKQ